MSFMLKSHGESLLLSPMNSLGTVSAPFACSIKMMAQRDCVSKWYKNSGGSNDFSFFHSPSDVQAEKFPFFFSVVFVQNIFQFETHSLFYFRYNKWASQADLVDNHAKTTRYLCSDHSKKRTNFRVENQGIKIAQKKKRMLLYLLSLSQVPLTPLASLCKFKLQ